MPVRGFPSHVDLTIRDPERSIPFYETFFTAIGWQRFHVDHPHFTGPSPRRAAWAVRSEAGWFFGIEVRPARSESREKAHDRYAPGLHHMAFHADSREDVDRVHEVMAAAGHEVLDPPAEYDYSKGYYAAFFADPDGLKVEVVYEPIANP